MHFTDTGPGHEMRSGATFSDDRLYRYALWRAWGDASKQFCIIGLNPSTADETKDDATIRRCIAFAKREGCGALMMLNLFAWRSTDPRVLKKLPSSMAAIGPKNNELIVLHTMCATKVVAAWGAHGSLYGRGNEVARMIDSEIELLCFGKTLAGSPLHPLYLSSETKLIPYLF